MSKTITIVRQEVFTRGVLRPFSWLYRLEYEGIDLAAADLLREIPGRTEPWIVNFEDRGLAGIEATARRIAKAQGATVVRGWALGKERGQ